MILQAAESTSGGVSMVEIILAAVAVVSVLLTMGMFITSWRTTSIAEKAAEAARDSVQLARDEAAGATEERRRARAAEIILMNYNSKKTELTISNIGLGYARNALVILRLAPDQYSAGMVAALRGGQEHTIRKMTPYPDHYPTLDMDLDALLEDLGLPTDYPAGQVRWEAGDGKTRSHVQVVTNFV